MDPRYAAWIEEHVRDDGYGQCEKLTEAMVAAFPELRRIPGWYHDELWGARQHWWCVTEAGEIVDPTAGQFPTRGLGDYEEYDGRPLPTNPCANCGGPVYDGNTVCSPACHAEYAAFCMRGFY